MSFIGYDGRVDLSTLPHRRTLLLRCVATAVAAVPRVVFLLPCKQWIIIVRVREGWLPL